jgi:hypothetical protein
MLMLTHTWILRTFLASTTSQYITPELFLHNVSPDILPVHKDITTDMTHGVERFINLPLEHSKAALAQFHLFVDDIAHHGKICRGNAIFFNPHSEGYTYRKGRLLIEPIMDFHRSIGQKLSFNEASYRSHILIEMAFDQALQDGEAKQEAALLFFDALNYTVENKLEDFCRTSSWLFGINEGIIAEAIRQGKEKYTLESADLFSAAAGRVALYTGKFGLDYNETRSGVEYLLGRGMDVVSDYGDFLTSTLDTIRETGFTCSL